MEANGRHLLDDGKTFEEQYSNGHYSDEEPETTVSSDSRFTKKDGELKQLSCTIKKDGELIKPSDDSLTFDGWVTDKSILKVMFGNGYFEVQRKVGGLNFKEPVRVKVNEALFFKEKEQPTPIQQQTPRQEPQQNNSEIQALVGLVYQLIESQNKQQQTQQALSSQAVSPEILEMREFIKAQQQEIQRLKDEQKEAAFNQKFKSLEDKLEAMTKADKPKTMLEQLNELTQSKELLFGALEELGVGQVSGEVPAWFSIAKEGVKTFSPLILALADKISPNATEHAQAFAKQAEVTVENDELEDDEEINETNEVNEMEETLKLSLNGVCEQLRNKEEFSKCFWIFDNPDFPQEQRLKIFITPTVIVVPALYKQISPYLTEENRTFLEADGKKVLTDFISVYKKELEKRNKAQAKK